jgi:hypothetical protein
VTLAPAPRDLRSGIFDLPAASGRLLEVSRAVSTDFRFLRFRNSASAAGAFNVRVPVTSAALTMTAWGGPFGGPAFEDDPGNLLTWGPELPGGSVITSPSFGAQMPLPSATALPARAGPLVVGGAGGFADVREALASLALTHAGERVTLELAPGVHEPFELGPELAFDLRLIAPPSARIDASLLAVRIAGLPAGRSVELVGLAIDARATTDPAPATWSASAARKSPDAGLAVPGSRAGHPTLLVEECEGVVLLDGVEIRGGARAPAVLLSSARAVVVQGGAIRGDRGVALERGSRASASGVELATIELTGRSSLETRGMSVVPRVEHGSSWRDHALPPLLVPSRSPGNGEGAGVHVTLETPPGSFAWLLVSPELVFIPPPNPLVEGVLLLDPLRLQVGGVPRLGGNARMEWTFDADARALCVQALVVDPARDRTTLSEVVRLD